MATYIPKKRTETGTEDLKFPISSIDGLQDDINQINGKTVDKIYSIDDWYGDRGTPNLNGNDGISWNETYALFDSDDNELSTGTISKRIPLAEGNNIAFEVDEENQVVKINATGGSSSGDEIVTTTGTGAAYKATVTGITALKAGVSFIMVPHTQSTSTAPTLNVNRLGAKQIKRPVSTNTNASQSGYVSNWIYAKKPIRLMYDGTYWIATDFPKVMAADLSGRVPVAGGGVPSVTTANNGQFLCVVDGVPAWVTIEDGDEVEY